VYTSKPAENKTATLLFKMRARVSEPRVRNEKKKVYLVYEGSFIEIFVMLVPAVLVCKRSQLSALVGGQSRRLIDNH